MAKVTKSLLKGLVKECLVEILAEGLASPDIVTEAKVSKQKKPNKQEHKRRKHPTDFMEVNTGKQPIKESVRQRIDAAAGGNDVMRDILSGYGNKNASQHGCS